MNKRVDYLGTEYSCEKTLIHEVFPTFFVEFWADKILKIIDFIVLSKQCSGQSEFAMGFDSIDGFLEGVGRDHMDFVQYRQSPF